MSGDDGFVSSAAARFLSSRPSRSRSSVRLSLDRPERIDDDRLAKRGVESLNINENSIISIVSSALRIRGNLPDIQIPGQVLRNDPRNFVPERAGPAMQFYIGDLIRSDTEHNLRAVNHLRQGDGSYSDAVRGLPIRRGRTIHGGGRAQGIVGFLGRAPASRQCNDRKQHQRRLDVFPPHCLVSFFPRISDSGWRSRSSVNWRRDCEVLVSSRIVIRRSCCSGASAASVRSAAVSVRRASSSVALAVGETSLSNRFTAPSALTNVRFSDCSARRTSAPISSIGIFSIFLAMLVSVAWNSSKPPWTDGIIGGLAVQSMWASGASGNMSSATYNWPVIRLPVLSCPRNPLAASLSQRIRRPSSSVRYSPDPAFNIARIRPGYSNAVTGKRNSFCAWLRKIFTDLTSPTSIPRKSTGAPI